MSDTEIVWPMTGEDAEATTADLKEMLAEIEKYDQDYDVRYGLVLMAMAAAWAVGIPAGFAIDPAQPGWPVAYIELPTGQASWHMPAHTTLYDGHSTAEKYARIKAYVTGCQPAEGMAHTSE
jgi:hypothetical protein